MRLELMIHPNAVNGVLAHFLLLFGRASSVRPAFAKASAGSLR
jgi:hypothetical protein